MSSGGRLASDASRPRSTSGFLTPTSDGSGRDGLPSASRKRRRDVPSLPMEDLLKPTIVVKPHPSNLTVKPHILQPLMLLPREHLPLSALDLSMPTGELSASPGRFYESQIRILDLEGRLGCNMLLARSDTTQTVYAIEWHENGLYVVCKLGNWIDVGKLSQHATVCCRQRLRPSAPSKETIVPEPPLTTPQLHKDSKKKRLAIDELQSLIRKRAKSQSISPLDGPLSQAQGSIHVGANLTSPTLVGEDSQEQLTSEPAAPEPQRQAPVLLQPNDESLDQPTAENIFQNIRSQYFEALYHSKGSLAYFAKGPLSRARAAFHLDCDANLEMKDLVDFLKSLIMTTIVIDKKYRETVPEILSKMKTLVDSSDDGERKGKKKKAKKMKLGKDGLYPAEDDHIKRWWSVHKPEVREEDESRPDERQTRYQISCLRTRETQLQIILILEILALEALPAVVDAPDSQLPGATPEKEMSVEGSSKKRNKHNFPVLVDIHADRLCIWQSTILDEVKVVAESQAIKDSAESQELSKSNSDPLKDFCVDIILPFFAPRLPEICDGLNRKLGGPVIMSPPKAKKPRSSSAAKPQPKPGAAAKRPMPAKSTRNLDRVLSNDRLKRRGSHGPADVLARMRSATPAAIPGFKREASEPVSLSNLPKGEPGSLKERSTNMLSRSNSSASLDDVKAKKKALVEAELQNAISALKKPNRQLAGKAIVEEAEKRTSFSMSQIKKAKKPTRTPGFNSIQVKATPANNRFRDALAGDSHGSGGFSFSQSIANPEFPSSSSVIPSSAPRKGLAPSLLHPEHVASTPVANKAKVTPIRPAAVPNRLFQPNLDEFVIPPSSPVQSRRAQPKSEFLEVPGTTTGNSSGPIGPSSPGLPGLFETPIKRRPQLSEETLKSTPPIGRFISPTNLPAISEQVDATPEVKKLTIYQQLGWDDDDDLDDLA